MPEYLRVDEEEAGLRARIRDVRSVIASHSGTDDAIDAQVELNNLMTRMSSDYPETDTIARPDGSTQEMRKHVEVWFMGCHSDVGGGNDLNDDPSLSNIPFR